MCLFFNFKFAFVESGSWKSPRNRQYKQLNFSYKINTKNSAHITTVFTIASPPIYIFLFRFNLCFVLYAINWMLHNFLLICRHLRRKRMIPIGIIQMKKITQFWLVKSSVVQVCKLQIMQQICSSPWLSLILKFKIMVNWQLSNKVSADRYHMTLSRAQV